MHSVTFPNDFFETRHDLAIAQEELPDFLASMPEPLKKMMDMSGAKHWVYPINAPTVISVIGGAYNIGDGINTFEMCDNRTGLICAITKDGINDYLKVNPVKKELSSK